MKTSTGGLNEERKKQLAVGAFAAVALVYLYFQFRDPTPTSAPPSAPVIVTAPATPLGRTPSSEAAGPAAKTVGTTSASLDPTLRMDAMLVTESVAYAGTGRNIFSAVSAPAPVVIQQPLAPARPQVAAPVAIQPQGPPPPPPIDLKFCGYFESPSSGDKQAILTRGDDTVLAHPGEIVMRRYRVVSIAARSIVVEDIPNNNRQTLPLLSNP